MMFNVSWTQRVEQTETFTGIVEAKDYAEALDKVASDDFKIKLKSKIEDVKVSINDDLLVVEELGRA